MRLLHDHQVNDLNTDCIRVEVLDEPDHENGRGAHHRYGIWFHNPVEPGTSDHQWEDGDPDSDENYIATRTPRPPDCTISFQHGPVQEHGVNGITQEALLAVVLDRFRSFQRGPFSCRENALVITKLEEALMWMHKRTLDRVRRGVEGRHAE